MRLKVLEEEHRESVRNALLLKHVHQHEKEFQKQISNGEKRPFPLIKSLADMGKKASHIDVREAAGGGGTPPMTAKPSSNLLYAANASNVNLNKSPTQTILETCSSNARINKVDSKQKVNFDSIFFLLLSNLHTFFISN